MVMISEDLAAQIVETERVGLEPQMAVCFFGPDNPVVGYTHGAEPCRPIHPRYQVIARGHETIYWQCPRCRARGIEQTPEATETVNDAWLEGRVAHPAQRSAIITPGAGRKRRILTGADLRAERQRAQRRKQPAPEPPAPRPRIIKSAR